MAVFSIIVPVYNVEKYLRQCLDSIVNQTFSDFEVICVNDGSTDNSLEILEEYSEKDNRFIVINQENQGQGVARNKAMDLATGDYIVFVDPDDYIDTSTLEILYSIFLTTNVPLIQFDYITFRDYDNKVRLKTFEAQSKKSLGYTVKPNSYFSWEIFKSSNLLTGIPLSACDKAYSREFIRKNNIKFAPNKHGEDHIFSLSSYFLANRIYYINKPFYHYRNRIGSAVNSASDDNFCIFDNIKILKEFLLKHNLYKKLEKEFEKYAMRAMTSHYTCIPEASIQRYIDNCSQILSSEENEKFLYKLKHKDKKFIERIFSLKNWKQYGQKKKIITILGFEFVINTPKGEAIERQN